MSITFQFVPLSHPRGPWQSPKLSALLERLNLVQREFLPGFLFQGCFSKLLQPRVGLTDCICTLKHVHKHI